METNAGQSNGRLPPTEIANDRANGWVALAKIQWPLGGLKILPNARDVVGLYCVLFF